MELTAVARVYVRRLSNQVPGCRNFSRKKLCRQGVNRKHACTATTSEQQNHFAAGQILHCSQSHTGL